MANDLIEFDVIQSGIKRMRDRAENGIKRITADFLVNNFFEDIEAMKKRGYRYDEIIDELNLLLIETIPEKVERDKVFAIKPGTLKVYMSRKRAQIAEQVIKETSEKQIRKKINKKLVTEETKQKVSVSVVKVESKPQTTKLATVPTGKARATNLDREI